MGRWISNASVRLGTEKSQKRIFPSSDAVQQSSGRMGSTITVVTGAVWPSREATFKPVATEKMETELAVHKRSFFASFEKAGEEVMQFLPPRIIFHGGWDDESISNRLDYKYTLFFFSMIFRRIKFRGKPQKKGHFVARVGILCDEKKNMSDTNHWPNMRRYL